MGNPSPASGFVVVILAAGASSRMGRPKLLLPWRDQSLIAYQIDQWRKTGASSIAVVIPPGAVALGVELERADVPGANRIINPEPERGMFSSIRTASEAPLWRKPFPAHWVLSLGDQPLLESPSLAELMRFASARPEAISQPRLHGRARHPVVFPQDLFFELARAAGPTLKEFLTEHCRRLAFWKTDDEAFGMDVDTPDAYEAARAFDARRLRGDRTG